MKKMNTLKRLCMLVLAIALVVGQLPAIPQVYAADEGQPSVTIDNCGSRLNARVENIANPRYQWQRYNADKNVYENIAGATEAYYDITAADEGAQIQLVVNETTTSEPTEPIGKLVVFDLSKGTVTLSTTYAGKDKNGISLSGTHAASNIYVVQQSNSAKTTNKISFEGNLPKAPFDVTLDGVNMGAAATNHNQSPGSSGVDTPTGGQIDIPATNDYVKKVVIRLKGENIVRHIRYYNGGDTQTPANVKSSLKFTDINGDGASTGGSLYMPEKWSTKEEIEKNVVTKDNYNHWNAGIGGSDSSSLVQNLTIAGGRIQVVTTAGDNCTAIGAGGNGYCQMEISGGEVYAYCNGTGAAIGGGIGWNAAGGPADVLISGGKVYAKNYSEIETTKDGVKALVGGVAIGAGSSFFKAGSDGNVTITGGTVEAYGTFGNGIGGGNSSTSTGGKANIDISGGIVEATSIGGGNSKKGTGGEADVTITDTAQVTLLKGIGGGASESGVGGKANVTVKNGVMDCAGVIGGGNGGGAYNGGVASINVSGGTLTAQSIGGGTGGTGGNGGAATINISGGKIETGSIGGGTTLNENGNLGYATAVISGGDIKGQFLMAAAGENACTFTMTGGILHGVDTADSSKYTYAQKDGAAVYMNDPKGVVSISGGTIKDCSAENGGAVYMTAGTFNLSENAVLENCNATVDGGAVYLGGGTMTVSGGTIQSNEAANNGGAVYLGGGTLKVSGGTFSNNTAGVDGGGAYVNGGNVNVSKNGTFTSNTATRNGGAIAVNNGNFKMIGGAVDGNNAVNGAGGGIYVASDNSKVDVDVLSGSVSNNTSASNGGAVAVYGKADATNDITVTVGVNKQHFGENGTPIACDHDDSTTTHDEVLPCPVISSNHTDGSGGAVYVTGNNEHTLLNLYCCLETKDDSSLNGASADNGQSNFMKVDGGKVVVCASQNKNEESQDAMHGNVQIQSTVYITGGQVDLWGDMQNPSFSDIIIVDITKKDDYFKDHRVFDEFYKLLYFENFKDPVTGIVTGQYKEKEVAANSTETIVGNIYSHPGYTIIGWNTQPDGKGQAYEVNQGYLFNGDPGDLTLYAIWESNAYIVQFNPNVPADEPYTGHMEDQAINYDETKALNPNNFSRPGYNFVGWTTVSDGSGDFYNDQAKVKNLALNRGDVVTLYAKWEKCTHAATETFIYTVIDDGSGLQRDCSCGGYSETVKLSANDTVYDKGTHPATAVYSSEGWKPEVVYKNVDKPSEEISSSGPVNAGTYKASITVTNVTLADGTTGDVTASVQYTIEKAEQKFAPPKPEFDPVISDDMQMIKVKPVVASPYYDEANDAYDERYDAHAEYRVVYYSGDTLVEMPWKAGAEGTYAAEFPLSVALTNYYVYVRYSEGTNYKPSEEKMADSIYFFAGNVQVVVTGGEGVIGEVIKTTADSAGHVNGITVKVRPKDGYYLPSDFDVEAGTYNIPAEGVTELTPKEPAAKLATTIKNQEYSITDIPTDCRIVVTLSNAKKKPTITTKATEGEVFGGFNGDNTVEISKDSAYTALFEMTGFDNAGYEEPVVKFNKTLPAATSIIMRDLNNNKYYRYITSDGATKEIELNNFVQMGTESARFVASNGDMKLQMVTDYAETISGLESNVDLSLALTAKNNTGAPNVASDIVKVLPKESDFSLQATATGLSGTIKYTYTQGGKASKWDNRHGAIVLKPNADLPTDAYIKYHDGDYNFNTYQNPLGYFVIPLSAAGSGEVKVELVSAMIPPNTTYEMDVRWIMSESVAGSSPINGQLVAPEDPNASPVVLEFNSGEPTIPSVKISSGADRLYSTSELITLNLNWQGIPLGNEINVTLLWNKDNKFTGTGWSDTIKRDANETTSHAIKLDKWEAGSYCLHVTVMEGLVRVNEAKYYFIIE